MISTPRRAETLRHRHGEEAGETSAEVAAVTVITRLATPGNATAKFLSFDH